MTKNLMIVESPAKAKTIEKYLGKDFIVKASFGHVRDLPKDDSAIDIKNNFSPKYEIIPKQVKVINELKQIIKTVDKVWLATDEDREGEAISWHLAAALGLDVHTTHRVVFNEITKTAITKAVQSPRMLDLNLVDAQQARRVLDRLVGFKLSPILWKKVKKGLSAGRVQSVAVKLVVEREREILNFVPVSSFKVVSDFLTAKKEGLKAELSHKINQSEDAIQFLESCKGAVFTVKEVEKKPGKRSPAPPFTTSTLQQEASRKLGMSVSDTMKVAQSLYESGKITYMRTDSINLSDTALQQAEVAIKQSFGEQYHQLRKFKNKNANAQEAHEAIRPTDFGVMQVEGSRNEQRLYELIWKRATASQMADAQLEKTVVDILTSTNQAIFKASGEVVLFDGFLKLYIESSDEEEDDNNTLLPPLKKGDILDMSQIVATERFTRPAARYAEASLVKKLEELGIGRPSTYAPTISTIEQRDYVEKGNREGIKREYRLHILKGNKISSSTKNEVVGVEKNKLFPTDLGMIVTDFLDKHFVNIMNYSFTASVEDEFDEIAEGKVKWQKMIAGFWAGFAETLEKTNQEADRAKSERLLGQEPGSERPIFAKLGKNGPLIQIGNTSDEEKPRFASLKSTQRIDTITLEEALELFILPRTIGEFEGKPVKAAIGRFGPYVLFGSTFVNLKTDSPYEITFERALQLYEEKLETDKNKVIRQLNDEVSILKGRWNAPYLKIGKENIPLPKEINVETLTLEDCYRLQVENMQKASKTNGQNSIQDFGEIQVLNGKYGPYIKKGKDNFKIPKDKSPETITKAECEAIIAETPKKKK